MDSSSNTNEAKRSSNGLKSDTMTMEQESSEMDKVTTRLRKAGLLSLFGCISGYAALNYFSNESLVTRDSWSYTQKRNLFTDPMMSCANEYYYGDTALIDFHFSTSEEDDEEDEESDDDDEAEEEEEEEKEVVLSLDKQSSSSSNDKAEEEEIIVTVKDDICHKQMAEIVQEIIAKTLDKQLASSVINEKEVKPTMWLNVSNWMKQKAKIITGKWDLMKQKIEERGSEAQVGGL